MKGYDEKYLQSCIDKAKKSWEGVDVDKFMNEIRGREDAPNEELNKAAEEFAHNYDMGACGGIAQDCFKAGAEWQRGQYECIPAEESYMRGFAQGAKEEREGLSPTMLTYAAEVFGGKTLLEDISYSYRQELADYFRDLARGILTQIKAREE